MKDWRVSANVAPGYFGARRESTRAAWNDQYGLDGWQLGWVSGSEIVDYVGACKFYEDAYFVYMLANPGLVEALVSIASDVYDDAPTNVGSGLDYTIQETERTHIQDIAIRNCVARLGNKFIGSELVQIRGIDTELSKALTPGQVPFHIPGLISVPDNLDEIYAKRWWKIGSVEDFYQLNKRLLVRA